MKPRTRVTPRGRRRTRTDETSRVPLDAVGIDTLELFALALMRAGYSASELTAAFERSVAKAPRLRKPRDGQTRREFHDTSDVLRLWVSDPDCVDADGRPLALPARGPAPSVQSLLKRARPDLPLEDALALFMRTQTLRRVGRRLIPTDESGEAVIHSPQSQTQSTHHVLVLNQLLRNFEFNSKRRRRGQRWPQRVAECPDFPADELPALIALFGERAKPFINSYNHSMARTARKAHSSTRRKRVAINLFLSVSPPSRIRSMSRRGTSKSD